MIEQLSIMEMPITSRWKPEVDNGSRMWACPDCGGRMLGDYWDEGFCPYEFCPYCGVRNGKRDYSCMALILITVIIILATPARAYEGSRITTARQDALHEAAEILRAAGLSEDDPALVALSAEWWAEQEALDIVARVVQGEAGNCPWAHQLAVAAVVVNRVNSPYFPNTVREVVAAPAQYTTLYLTGFDKTSRQCYEAAKKALDGESGVPEDVIWQAEFIQGAEVWWRSEVDTGWYHSVTYFCRGVA